MNRSTANPSSQQSSSSQSELLCRVKYLNNLPDIPSDPKFIAYPFDPTRFIKYNSTTLEKSFKWDILHEQDLGIRIDLINPEKSNANVLLELNEIDEKLLEEETTTAADVKRSEQHSKSVSWLRRNEYISTENTRFQPKVYDQVESKLGSSIKRKLSQIDFYKDRDSQIKAIEKSFDAAKQPIDKHFSKQGVFPLQVLPIYPDFEQWKFTYSQVIFDTDPAASKSKNALQAEEMSQAMIKSTKDKNDEEFVGYFLPNEETLSKRKRDEQENDSEPDFDDEYNYKLIREYTWSVKKNTDLEENCNFIFKDDGVYYNPLATRVRLNKRRAKGGKISNIRLAVKYRNYSRDELKQQRSRVRVLEQINEEDGEDEEEEEENDEEMHEKSQDEENNESDDASNQEEQIEEEEEEEADDSDEDDE